jgi:hypothetical protein
LAPQRAPPARYASRPPATAARSCFASWSGGGMA